ncbi:MAG TPA: carboxypeptidase-like regulatory domain-containing protein, partial [Thermoanaerobaculia bacterium]|nr:carboxypeptidase-like regulatory domain-containing protein [Thermoanaerobaculia bacterium]
MTLPPGRWALQAEAPGHWGEVEQLEVTGASEVTLDLWPAGTVEGGFLSQEREQPPSELALFFRMAPSSAPGAGPPPSQTLCPVKKGTWRCAVPRGVLDLRFQVDGFIPRYQWGVSILPGKTARLGRLELTRGSAVMGWVVTADGSPIREDARVELRPRMAGAITNEAESSRVKGLSHTTRINERGFFQIDAVPPGAYVVEVTQAPFAPAVASVRVVPGTVTDIANPPLTLDMPRTLEVFLNPPTDPQDRPWSVRLSSLERSTMVLKRFPAEPADASGAWKIAGISEGSYLLQVGPQDGDTWLTEQVEVGDNPAPLHLDLDVIQVKGTVHLGESPLAAELIFGGRFGSSRIKARSNNEGAFELHLPRRGEWTVQVTAEAPPVNRELSKVEVRPSTDGSVARLALELPDTKLQGRVVDEKGVAVPRALVGARRAAETRVQERVDEEGKFEIFGLPAGPVIVGAEAEDDMSSDQLTVELVEGRDPEPVTLVVRPRLRIRGTLVSASGAVPGANVKAAPVGVPVFGVRSVATDAQGQFEVTLPPSAREMFLAVSAPGFAFRMLRLPVPEDRKITVGVEQPAGTLILETDVPHVPVEPEGPYIFVLHKGSLEGLPYLSGWAMSSGEVPDSVSRSVIPDVEPGDYQACWILPAERPGLDFGVLPQGRCVEGFLSPNGELTLKLPSPPAREPRQETGARVRVRSWSRGELPPIQAFPGSFGQLPGGFGQLRNFFGQLPGSSGQHPGPSGQLPEALGQVPEIFGQLPGASGQLPASSGKLPEPTGK